MTDRAEDRFVRACAKALADLRESLAQRAGRGGNERGEVNKLLAELDARIDGLPERPQRFYRICMDILDWLDGSAADADGIIERKVFALARAEVELALRQILERFEPSGSEVVTASHSKERRAYLIRLWEEIGYPNGNAGIWQALKRNKGRDDSPIVDAVGIDGYVWRYGDGAVEAVGRDELREDMAVVREQNRTDH